MKRAALVLIVLAYAVLLGVTVWAGAVSPGYDHARQYMSELGATGAPTGRAMSLYGFLPAGVLVLMWAAATVAAAPRVALRWLGALLIGAYGWGMINAVLYPCDAGCPFVGGSPAQAMHNLVGGLTYLAGAAGLFVLAAEGRRKARWMPALGVACGLAAVIGLWLVAPGFPWRGAAQRTLEAGMAVFLIGWTWADLRGGRDNAISRAA